MPALAEIAAAAQRYGFHKTAAIPVAEVDAAFCAFYQEYLARGLAADLKYLSRPERFNPLSILPSARTLLLFFYPYRFRAVEDKLRTTPFKIARYAWQKDYHVSLRAKLTRVLTELALTGRAVTDSAPLFERYWARRAGMGFVGKNGMLIDRASGSYFFIAAALIEEGVETGGDIPLRREARPLTDDFSEICKDCRLCVDSCPTGALFGDGLMQTEKCISYRTIETKAPAAYAHGDKKHRWIFGCDICQQVCPYNKTAASFAQDMFNDEHPVVAQIAAGADLPARARLKESVFLRRGPAKLRENIAALEP